MGGSTIHVDLLQLRTIYVIRIFKIARWPDGRVAPFLSFAARTTSFDIACAG